MSRAPLWLAVPLLSALLAATAGCPNPSTKTRTPAQYFKEKQASTMTPYGKVVPDSVEEKDDKIQFRTKDGKTWKVGYTRRADGTYEYGDPEEVK